MNADGTPPLPLPPVGSPVDRGADDAFRPPGENWVRVSPKLATAQRIRVGLGALPFVAAAVVLVALDLDLAGGIVAAVTLVATVWIWVVIGRRVRAIGYAERGDDLLVTSGILLRRLVIVPYGRMQLVDVTAGPIDRMLGITTVQLHTAAATTDAHIPGLDPSIAADLRDRLASRGEGRSSGL